MNKLFMKVVVLLGVLSLVMLSGCTQYNGSLLPGTDAKSDSMEKGEQVSGMNEMEGMDEMAEEMNQNEEVVKEAVVNGEIQEVILTISATGYSPDVIIAKKGVPLKINVHADEDTGCAREILFPDFEIHEDIPPGTSNMIEILPDEEGTFGFRCAMDMYRGKLVIQ